MRSAWIGAAALVLAGHAWGLDVRIGAGCAVHLARHPGFEEPLDDPPALFLGAGVELLSYESGLVADLAAGWAEEATDGQVTFSFRHSLAVDWGVFTPFLQAGVGWATRFRDGRLTHSSLFPEAGAGLDAAMGAFTWQVFAAARPVPMPLFEAEQYPLRRVALSARVRWEVPQRGRSGLRGLR